MYFYIFNVCQWIRKCSASVTASVVIFEGFASLRTWSAGLGGCRLSAGVPSVSVYMLMAAGVQSHKSVSLLLA